MVLRLYIVFGFFGLLALSCQKKPGLAPAIDPLSALEPPPMGATTYNDELKHSLAVLDKLLNQGISQQKLESIKKALIAGDGKSLNFSATSDEAYLVKVLLALPELIHEKHDRSLNRKIWMQAKLYFINRRFIEAAQLMTQVLEKEPLFFEARNWRARAIFFLGNPDKAVSELNLIINQTGASSIHGLDALYLIGAIIYESDDKEAHRVQKGIDAWHTYLKLADAQENLTQEINDGLKELSLRLTKQPMITNSIDPFAPHDSYSTEKNTLLEAFGKDELLLALQLSDRALKKKFDPDIATIKARALFKTGRHDEAAQIFVDITTKYPRYAPGFHYQGMVFMMQGQPKRAIESWQKAMEVDLTYGQAHGLRQRIAVAEKMVAPQKIPSH